MSGRMELLPKNEIVQLLEGVSATDQPAFWDAMHQIREDTSRALLRLCLDEERLEQHLLALNQFLLLQNGEFYQAFFDETKQFFAFPPLQNRKSEQQLNGKFIPRLFLKLSLDEEFF